MAQKQIVNLISTRARCGSRFDADDKSTAHKGCAGANDYVAVGRTFNDRIAADCAAGSLSYYRAEPFSSLRSGPTLPHL